MVKIMNKKKRVAHTHTHSLLVDDDFQKLTKNVKLAELDIRASDQHKSSTETDSDGWISYLGKVWLKVCSRERNQTGIHMSCVCVAVARMTWKYLNCENRSGMIVDFTSMQGYFCMLWPIMTFPSSLTLSTIIFVRL